jgi:hypothetical protein
VGDPRHRDDELAWEQSGKELITSISVWLFYTANPHTSDGGPSITGYNITFY